MIPVAIPAIAVLAQYLQDQTNDRNMRRQKRADLAGQRAAELGYPTAGMQAAQTNAAANASRGPSYIGALLPYMMEGSGSEPPAKKGGDIFSEDEVFGQRRTPALGRR